MLRSFYSVAVRLFSTLFCCCISWTLLAADGQHWQGGAFSYYCTDKYQQCLGVINERLAVASVEQRDSLLLQRAILEIIFGRHQVAEKLLAPLTDSPHLTVMEHIEVAIQRAKNMFQLGDVEQAKRLGLEAQRQLAGIANDDLSWNLMVEYGTILLYLGKHRQSWEVLSTLLGRSHEGVPVRILADFYGVLGHLALEMQRNQLMLDYLRKSYQYTLQQGNDQQSGISAHNLARAYVINMDYRRAQALYRRAIKSSIKAGDMSNVVYTRYHLVKMNVEMGHFRIAKRLFANLLASDYSVNSTVTDEKLRLLLKRINNGLYRDY